ncbi:MAG TPA: polysaccharide deacetylase family protein [Symbiobacteriaceae bacterium]|nr:polysaccharide deacetylase family protein [Symbiobacteriaceae bacterium]
MRAHFRVIRVNRWGLAAAILAVLAVLLLRPGARFLTVGATPSYTVQPGVTIGRRDFSGASEQAAKQMLAQMAPLYRTKPDSAYQVKFTDGSIYVIPETNGYELDVEATWTRLATARANTVVAPATRLVTPTKKLGDFPKAVIRHGNPTKQAVGLLINVDWGSEELAQMLPVLKNRGAKVTFFVSGRWAAKPENKGLIDQMVADGHEVASHGHVLTEDGPLDLAKRGKLRSDIETSVKVIQEKTGLPVRYYAPHKSQISPEILRTADELKLRTVLYSLDTRDWMREVGPVQIMDTFRKAMAGDLILLHPKPNTAKVLDQAVQHLQGKGLAPVTLSDLLSPEPETPPVISGGH